MDRIGTQCPCLVQSSRRNGAIRGALFCLLLLVSFSLPVMAEEIDRLVVAVNGVAITEGDLDLARNLKSIVFLGKTAEAVSRHEEIERQIDQELMRQELKNFAISDEENKVDARMQSLREAYAAKGGLGELLRRTGMQESELVSYIRLETSILRFVDFRFRPFVSVSPDEISAYYKNRLMPQLQKAGIGLPALEQVSGRIDSILREEKINEALDQWIKEIRRNSRIEYFDETQ